MGLFLDILCPALKVLALLEERGIPLDVARRDALREETITELGKAQRRIMALAQDAHDRRRARIQECIDALDAQTMALLTGAAQCPQHQGYVGTTKRTKDECCRAVFENAAELRAKVKALSSSVGKGRAKLEQVGEKFDPKNDWHWRFLLFDELGLGLTPVAWTGKAQEPSVDEEAIEKLGKRYPDVELLRLRVVVQQAKTRLKNRLSVEPGPDGRVHSPYSLSRTWNCRISSGDDDEEEDKARRGEGNLQNIPKKDRQIYRAEPGMVFVQADLSQVEARVQAWLGRDAKMLAAWRDGLDIHALTAAAIFGIEPGASREHMVKWGAEMVPAREVGKMRRHAGNYGQGLKGFADRTGISLAEAARVDAADRGVWARLYEAQREEIARAARDRRLTNPFGCRVYFFQWRKGKAGDWELARPQEALSFRPSSSVANMIQAMLPAMNALPGELLTTTHDSYLTQVENSREAVRRYVEAARPVLEQEWPQMGAIEGFGFFRCPVDFEVGLRWAPKRYDEEGLEGYEEWMRAGSEERSGASATRASIPAGECSGVTSP